MFEFVFNGRTGSEVLCLYYSPQDCLVGIDSKKRGRGGKYLHDYRVRLKPPKNVTLNCPQPICEHSLIVSALNESLS